jgi:predicted DCC family thiol-disulfide oxidoreductase YuxK
VDVQAADTKAPPRADAGDADWEPFEPPEEEDLDDPEMLPDESEELPDWDEEPGDPEQAAGRAHAQVSRMASAGADRALLLYDADCRFCRWALRRVLAWDRAGRLRPVALQDPAAARLLSDLDERERMASWHLVDPAGRCSSAGAALAPLLRMLPGGGAPARLAERFPAAVEAGYALVAGNRSWLSRVVGAFGAR